MKIIIDIDEENYKNIKEQVSKRDYPNMQIGRAIANGIPFPKCRGRLLILSEDAVKKERVPVYCSCQLWISDIGLSNATVAIIEADKGRKRG